MDSARRVPQLDGIRGAAILLVIIWHFIVVPLKQGPHDSAISRIIAQVGVLTWSGVDLFFVLSGFLIGGILIDARESPNYFRTFYVRRAFRILPIYLLVVVSYLLVWSIAAGHQIFLRETLGVPMPWWIYFTFTQNFWLAHHAWDSVYLTLSWSLAVEEQFYLLLPAVIRIVPRQSLLPVAVILALSSAFSRCFLYLHYGATWGTAAYTLICSRADALMLGGYLRGALPGPQLESSADKKSLGYQRISRGVWAWCRNPHLQTLGRGNRAHVYSGIYLSRLVLWLRSNGRHDFPARFAEPNLSGIFADVAWYDRVWAVLVSHNAISRSISHFSSPFARSDKLA